MAVFRIGQLGDTIAAFPAISAIRAGYSRSRMVLITDEHIDRGFVSSWDLLGATGIFSEVLSYAPTRSYAKRFLSSLFLAWRLRRWRADVLFYLAPFPRDARQVRRDRLFFGTVCGIRELYGLDATDHLIGQRNEDGRLAQIPSETDRLLSIVQNARLSVPAVGAATFNLPITQKEIVKVDAFWNGANFNQTNGPVIGIGPGSKMPAKRWPLDRFIEVARSLYQALPEARFIILGGPEDYELGLRITAAVGKKAVNLAGQLTVLETAEALRRCALYLGNDTGVMHLAAAVRTQCVAVFSARDNPGKWNPYGDGHIVFRKYVPCEGCLLVECQEYDMACLKEISAREVSTACLAVLNRV